MNHNPLNELGELGQSVWLDYIRRDLMTGGELKRLVEDDGVRGMTSNPAIFEKAIDESNDYADDIGAMTRSGADARAIYESITRSDVCSAADVLRLLYNRTYCKDGYVSLEVNPHLAHDTNGTIDEALRLWKTLDRPNVLIKVPATDEGIPAIRRLVGEGVNINVTLVFGLARYRQVAEAYIAGVEECAGRGEVLHTVASVASFFVSRIDALVDPQLDGIIARGGEKAIIAGKLLGEVAIAQAKAVYRAYWEIFATERFKALAQRGAQSQRLLWASTATKNPDYSDVKYVEALIGPDTVSTIPMETLNAYRDHGVSKARLETGQDEADDVLRLLPELGISMDAVARQLEAEGIRKFNEPFDKLMDTLAAEPLGI